ncbi:hemerythrin domain-containing protein [Caldimonas tepidiphila]|uniref:hemerythrin domain-containing protein n=1 Tax=Caldimonas tepidiphila TaxID=2315841 RepID=UPI000E5C2CBB|nr:hemerythrin domain-containing protein [Caldimonas tepidiphila]
MSRTALRVIREEHRALASMLRSLELLVEQLHRHRTPPDFGLIRAMLFYIDEFPERLHHPKESQLLFPLLRARCAEIVEVLDRLDADHDKGEQAVRELQHALLGYEMMGESRREAFEQALHRYVEAYLEHMSIEEDVVLPMAQRVLTPEEWQRLDAAFEANRDPLAGHEPDAAYHAVFQKILNRAPAPIGLGSETGRLQPQR